MKIPRRDNNIKNVNASETTIKLCVLLKKTLLFLSHYLLATITLIKICFYVVRTDIWFLFHSVLWYKLK